MNSRSWRVLVVDANEDVRSVVEDLLVDHGFDVRHAANLDQAILELRSRSFDVLLCHLELLRSENGSLARRAREIRPLPRVVAMSAAGGEAKSDEADANLPKPFTRVRLVATLRPS